MNGVDVYGSREIREDYYRKLRLKETMTSFWPVNSFRLFGYGRLNKHRAALYVYEEPPFSSHVPRSV